MTRFTIAKLPARFSFCVISLISIAIYNFWLRENDEAHLIILVILLAVTGLPHGAIDPAIARQAGWWEGTSGLLKFSLGYLTLSVIVVAIWLILPELFIVPMLAFSAWHFSEDWLNYFDRLASLAISSSVITLPALFYPEELLGIFAVLTPATDQIIVNSMRIVSIISVLAVSILCLDTKKPNTVALLELSILFFSAFALPPIAYFTVYFCVLHSPIHLSQSLKKLGLSKTLIYAVPFTILSFMAAAILFLSLPHIDIRSQFIQVIFVGLLALTVPHMLLIGMFNQETKRNI
jgi:Brp/Blh family beta-carotene 15,15'-monooxygenase